MVELVIIFVKRVVFECTAFRDKTTVRLPLNYTSELRWVGLKWLLFLLAQFDCLLSLIWLSYF